MLILWVWLALLAIFFGISLRFVVFHGVSHFLAPFDQRRLVAMTSSLFCSALEVNSSILADFYSFEDDPDTTKDRFSYVERHDISISQNESAMFPFYLLRGSDVIINVTSVRPIIFTVLRGEHALERWIKKQFESGTKTTGTKFEIQFHFDKSEEFGIAFTNERLDPDGADKIVEFSVIFKVRRERIYLMHNETNCKKTNVCKLYYRFNSRQTVLVDVPFFNRSGYDRKHGNENFATDDTTDSRGGSYSVPPPFVKSPDKLAVAFSKEDISSDKKGFMAHTMSHRSETLNMAPPGGETLDLDVTERIPELYYRCVPNIYVYLFVFVLVPLALGSLGSAIIYICQGGERDDENVPLLDEQSRNDIMRKYSNVWLY
jgi:hypothetical protein